MAQQQTTTAAGSGTDSAGQALRLFPRPGIGAKAFWAVHAVNDATQHRVFDQFVSDRWNTKEDPLVKLSICAAEQALHEEACKSFRSAQKAGALLFAWYGSSALEGGAA